MRCRLNKSAIAGAAPTAKPYQLHDTEVQGFLLRVQPSGTAAYYFEYRNAQGRKLRNRIGRQSALDVDQARKLAKIVAGKVAAGVDIQAERKRERKDFAAERRRTLSVFLDEQYEPWARVHLKSAKPTMDRLRVDFAKWLGRRMNSCNRWFIEGWRKKGTRTRTLASHHQPQCPAAAGRIVQSRALGPAGRSPLRWAQAPEDRPAGARALPQCGERAAFARRPGCA
jgi:hypothetical protein